MAYVVTAIWEFDCVAHGGILLGVAGTPNKAFSMIKNFDLYKEFEGMFYENTKLVFGDHRVIDFGTDEHTNRAFYGETVYTTNESDVCGSVTFTIYDIKEELY